MITLGPLTIYRQGIFLLVAVIVASYLFWRGGVKAKFDEEELFDFILATLVGGLGGGRLAHFLLAQDLTVTNLVRVFKVWESGGTFWFGGLLFGFLAGTFFAWRRHWPLLKIWDLAVPPLLLAEAIITLPSHLVGALIIGFGGGGSLYLQKLEPAAGLLLVYYLFFVALLKFVGEFWVTKKIYFLGLNANQLFAVLLFLLAVILSKKILVIAAMKRISLKTIKPRIPRPREALSQVRAFLAGEEKRIETQAQRLKAGDPLFEPGRTQSNPELVAEAEEEIGHRRMEAVAGVLKHRLSQVRKALSRVKKGKYGVCERCGQKIDPARLKVDPSVTLCVDCQDRKEQLASPPGSSKAF